ncbi:MAG TPA: hypothetical protein VNN73_19780 [Blastocatellia bacterium]|nr:hypothetical protein [Blastocatellia bacterium]
MDKEDNGATPAERLNYFNYFTEVEEEFVRRRGKSLLISPMEWALVESWKNAGIPLHVVLRAINQAFDAYDARPRKYRRVNSIFYCQQEVEATYAEYCLAMVGSSPATNEAVEDKPGKKKKRSDKQTAAPFPKEVLADFFTRATDELRSAEALARESGRRELETAIGRARSRVDEIAADVESSAQVDAEAIERDLDLIDRMILEAARKTFGESEIEKIRAEAESRLKAYRKKMDRAIYEQTVQNFVLRRLREMSNVPRLSLFYL